MQTPSIFASLGLNTMQVTPFHDHGDYSHDLGEESCGGSQSRTSHQEINVHHIHVGKYDNSIPDSKLLAMGNYTFRNVDFAFMAILDHLVSLLNEYQE